MNYKIALSSNSLLQGSYTIKNIENIINNARDDCVISIDVISGNILLHGKKILWGKKAQLERRCGELALLNALRNDSGICCQKYTKVLLNHAAYNVLHRKRPLTVRTVRALVREIRSQHVDIVRGRELLTLHTAQKLVIQDARPLLEAACGYASARPGSQMIAVSTGKFSLFQDMARGILALIRGVFRGDTPEYLFRTLFCIREQARAWSRARPENKREERCVCMAEELSIHMAVEALCRAGMDRDFGGRFLACRVLPEPHAFFKDLLALSRPGRRRDLHTAVVETSSGMLDIWQGLHRAVAKRCGVPCPRMFPLRVGKEHDRAVRLRPLAAELCRVPPEFRRVEASAAFQDEVLRHLAPLSTFEHNRGENDPYQVEKTFVQDIVREYSHLHAFVPDEETEGRVHLEFSTLRREMLDLREDSQAFGVEVARLICGGDRKAIYALTSVLHQGACNSVLMALHAPNAGASLGFTYLPLAFRSRDAFKRVDVERLPDGDYTVSTCWRTAVQMVGRLDPVLKGWLDMRHCRAGQSVFGIDIRLRLRNRDIACGICRPVLDHLFLEMGLVLRDE